MITKFLINHNYEVHSAPNGRVGIDLCQKFLPGLIILDLTLPILNGDSLIKQSFGLGVILLNRNNRDKNAQNTAQK